MKLNPLDDRVVVEPLTAEEKTAGGIVLPDTAKEKPQRGKVIAVGPGRLLDSGERSPIAVAIGDEVLFAKYGGTEIEIDKKEIKILRESDILAKVTALASVKVPGRPAALGETLVSLKVCRRDFWILHSRKFFFPLESRCG